MTPNGTRAGEIGVPFTSPSRANSTGSGTGMEEFRHYRHRLRLGKVTVRGSSL